MFLQANLELSRIDCAPVFIIDRFCKLIYAGLPLKG